MLPMFAYKINKTELQILLRTSKTFTNTYISIRILTIIAVEGLVLCLPAIEGAV